MLISTFKKINLNIVLAVVLDALFYYASGFFLILWLQRILDRMASFNLPSDITSLGYAQAQQLASETKAFYYLMILSFILVMIVIIFLAGIIKGIIWARTTKTKITLKFLSKFTLINLAWMGFWFAVFFVIIFMVQLSSAPIFMFAAFVLSIYGTNTLYTMLMKKQKFSSIVDAIKLNAKKIHLFLLPYLIFFGIFFIIANLSILVKLDFASYFLISKLYSLFGIETKFALINPLMNFVIGVVIRFSNPVVLLLVAFGRSYFSTIVAELQNQQAKYDVPRLKTKSL